MLRAMSGAISSGETFWLIADMRRKERSGPGIDIALLAGDACAGAGDTCEAAAVVAVDAATAPCAWAL
jgi:hypothetical protein